MKKMPYYKGLMKAILKTAIKRLLNRGVGSQFGEDMILAKILPTRGFYVDVGAYHPHLYSNTYRLYQKGWNGIAIDPNKNMRILFTLFRPRDTFINAGIGNGTLPYNSYDDGAYNGFNTHVPSRVTLRSTHSVKCLPLSQIVTGVSQIDLLNVDVEGMDLEVLTSHDWSVPTGVIAVEGEEKSPTTDFLIDKGCQLYTVAGKTLIFRRPQ